MTVYSGECGDSVTWTLDDSTGVLTISGTGEIDHGSNMPWGRYTSDIKHIVIEEGITRLGDYAFMTHQYSESVTIASTVTEIGRQAFYQCIKLTSVTFNGNQPTMDWASFSAGTSSKPVTCTVYSKGWASDDVFTTDIKGDYTTFIYEKVAPTVHVNVSGTWKEATPYVNVNGTWKEVTSVHVNVSGTWKEVS